MQQVKAALSKRPLRYAAGKRPEAKTQEGAKLYGKHCGGKVAFYALISNIVKIRCWPE